MGYIIVVIPSGKVNRAEEGGSRILNISRYGFKRNQKSRIGIGILYPMTYSYDGIYVPSNHGVVPLTVTRKGKVT